MFSFACTTSSFFRVGSTSCTVILREDDDSSVFCFMGLNIDINFGCGMPVDCFFFGGAFFFFGSDIVSCLGWFGLLKRPFWLRGYIVVCLYSVVRDLHRYFDSDFDAISRSLFLHFAPRTRRCLDPVSPRRPFPLSLSVLPSLVFLLFPLRRIHLPTTPVAS